MFIISICLCLPLNLRYNIINYIILLLIFCAFSLDRSAILTSEFLDISPRIVKKKGRGIMHIFWQRQWKFNFYLTFYLGVIINNASKNTTEERLWNVEDLQELLVTNRHISWRQPTDYPIGKNLMLRNVCLTYRSFIYLFFYFQCYYIAQFWTNDKNLLCGCIFFCSWLIHLAH